MIKLKNVIQQLSNEQYDMLCSQFTESKADKFLNLFMLYRENELEDDEIANNINVNSNAYYTLKSRLFDKVQDFITETLDSPKTDLLKKVSNIPTLLFNYHRETAIAILHKLETELKDYDLPYELTNVYSALKKLHLHTPKYYEYAQLYNKHVAYTLALDEAEDLVSNFFVKVGDFYLSRDLTIIPLLKRILLELSNVSRLYESHHLTVYKGIAEISYELYIGPFEKNNESEPVEDILLRMGQIIDTYPKDPTYRYLENIFHLLQFEYYHKLKQYKKSDQYFDKANDNLKQLLLSNHCSFPTVFLLSKLERAAMNNTEATLNDEAVLLQSLYSPDYADIANLVNYYKYIAATAFYKKDYNETVSILNDLLNKVSFKGYPHAEIEVKIFLALTYVINEKYDLAASIIRSVSRRIKETNESQGYENANTLIKMFNMIIGVGKKDLEKKLIQLRNTFELLNTGPNRILEFIRFDDKLIKRMIA